LEISLVNQRQWLGAGVKGANIGRAESIGAVGTEHSVGALMRRWPRARYEGIYRMEKRSRELAASASEAEWRKVTKDSLTPSRRRNR
jgi:hypothetical protein